MISASDIFLAALALMGDDDGGRYQERAVEGIHLLLADLYFLDQTLKGEVPAPDAPIPAVSDLTDDVDVADVLGRTLMPLGLAAFLLGEEDGKRASFFHQIYRTEKEILQRTFAPGRRHAIRNLY